MNTKALLSLVAGISLLCSCHTAPASREGGNRGGRQCGGKNEVVNTILQRRSIRKYKPQPIEKDKWAQIVECGVYAPQRERTGIVGSACRGQSPFVGFDRFGLQPFHGKGQEETTLRAAYGAPVLVFIAYDTTYDLSQVDCGLLGGNMMIAAQSLGIGSCCLGGICRFLNEPEGRELLDELDFPETHKLLYAIAFGYPDEEPSPKPRDMNKVGRLNDAVFVDWGLKNEKYETFFIYWG